MKKEAGTVTEAGYIDRLSVIDSDPLAAQRHVIDKTNEIIDSANEALKRANQAEKVLAVLIGRLEQHTHDAAGRAVVTLDRLS